LTGVVVCSGAITDYNKMKSYIDIADLLICADGGAVHLKKWGVIPDILVGDMDSISEESLRKFQGEKTETIKLKVEKDVTDTEFALDMAIERDCDKIYLLGALGGPRMDHMLANIFLLKHLLEKGVQGIIADEYNEITLIKDKISFDDISSEGSGYGSAKISLIPLTECVTGVTTKGLYYPLDNAILKQGSSRGVSNEIAGRKAEVSIKSGLLLVFCSRE
jgi:thiamine pyrophosphokinase